MSVRTEWIETPVRLLDFIAQIPSWSRAMTNQPFFTRDADAFIPTAAANGPWDPKSLHGRVIVGLLAFVIEQRHGSDDFVPARLTVDMFRLPGFAPIEVKSRRDPRRPAHQGGRGRIYQRRRQHGAGVVPVAAQNRKSRRQGVVAAELGRACALRIFPLRPIPVSA